MQVVEELDVVVGQQVVLVQPVGEVEHHVVQSARLISQLLPAGHTRRQVLGVVGNRLEERNVLLYRTMQTQMSGQSLHHSVDARLLHLFQHLPFRPNVGETAGKAAHATCRTGPRLVAVVEAFEHQPFLASVGADARQDRLHVLDISDVRTDVFCTELGRRDHVGRDQVLAIGAQPLPQRHVVRAQPTRHLVVVSHHGLGQLAVQSFHRRHVLRNVHEPIDAEPIVDDFQPHLVELRHLVHAPCNEEWIDGNLEQRISAARDHCVERAVFLDAGQRISDVSADADLALLQSVDRFQKRRLSQQSTQRLHDSLVLRAVGLRDAVSDARQFAQIRTAALLSARLACASHLTRNLVDRTIRHISNLRCQRL